MMTRRACVKFLATLLTSLIVSTACEKMREMASGKGKSTEAERTSNADWFGFTPYPGARQLCNQFTQGFSSGKPMEIHWATFATRDATEDVITFYAKAESGNVEVEGNSITVRRGNPVETVLSVHAASTTHYPTCANPPLPEEETVIDVSRILKP